MSVSVSGVNPFWSSDCGFEKFWLFGFRLSKTCFCFAPQLSLSAFFHPMAARKLPFGIKAPSKGTVIFGSIVAGISGVVYASNHYANQSQQRLFDRVTWLADRPLGVHVRQLEKAVLRKIIVCLSYIVELVGYAS
jgi:hypothetical protein